MYIYIYTYMSDQPRGCTRGTRSAQSPAPGTPGGVMTGPPVFGGSGFRAEGLNQA